MPLGRRTSAIGGVLAASVALSACGGSSSSSSVVTPAAYMKTVCQTVISFRQQLQASSNALHAVTDTALPARKQALQTFLTSFSSSAKSAASKIEGAGSPNVSNGKQVSSALDTVFTRLQSSLNQDAATAKSLSTQDPTAFKNVTAALGHTMQTQGSAVSGGLTGLKSPALESAAKKEPACQRLRSGA